MSVKVCLESVLQLPGANFCCRVEPALIRILYLQENKWVRSVVWDILVAVSYQMVVSSIECLNAC